MVAAVGVVRGAAVVRSDRGRMLAEVLSVVLERPDPHVLLEPVLGAVLLAALLRSALGGVLRVVGGVVGVVAAMDDCGSDVVVAPWVTHRHPGFWDDPERFDPERFTPEREKARHRYAWFPFGGGPRACIGQHFSMLESTIALSALVRNFEFRSPDRVPPYTNHITLRPTATVPVTVTPRRVEAVR